MESSFGSVAACLPQRNLPDLAEVDGDIAVEVVSTAGRGATRRRLHRVIGTTMSVTPSPRQIVGTNMLSRSKVVETGALSSGRDRGRDRGVVIYFTLQFLRTEQRSDVVRAVHRRLKDGWQLRPFGEMWEPHTSKQDLVGQFYPDFKLSSERVGPSEMVGPSEILVTSYHLRSVSEPASTMQNLFWTQTAGLTI